jgi:signal transduction histidine kinase
LQEQSQAGQLKKSSLADFLTGTGEASEILERSLAKAAALVTRFKKLAENDSTEKLSSFDLADVASVAASSITHGLKGTAVSLLNQVPAGIFMTGYPDLVEQVLGNLLNNAVLHGFDNIPSGQITLLARTFNQSVEISINDNGNGIPEAIQSRIFDPMFTTRMGRGGMGLGLSVVHNIVTRKLGGRIQMHAVQPHGASFVVTVPLVAPPQVSDD